jgi:hypothetical protein
LATTRHSNAAILILTEAAALALAGELIFLWRALLASCPANYFCFLSGFSFPLSVFLGEWTDNKSLRGG